MIIIATVHVAYPAVQLQSADITFAVSFTIETQSHKCDLCALTVRSLL